MSIAPDIQTLLAPPDVAQSNARAHDLLDAHALDIDDPAVLDTLARLLDAARVTRDDHRRQLTESTEKTNKLIAETRESANAHLYSAQELSLLRHSLADELSSLSEALVSSMPDGPPKATLLEDLESMHRTLKELQHVKGYVSVIQRVMQLGESAVSKIQPSSSSAIPDFAREYQTLRDFTSTITKTCESTEDASGTQKLKLVTFLDYVSDLTWTNAKTMMSSSLLDRAEKVGWPKVVDYISVSREDRDTFEAGFKRLLELQDLCDDLQTESSKDAGCYPLQALIQPLSQRFKYHFEASRATNRLDKPEWFFTHIFNIAHEHRHFMDTVIQPLLDAHYAKQRQLNAWREFTRLLLPILHRKLRRTVPAMLSHPSLLAHTIHQALTFDNALQAEGFTLIHTYGQQPSTPSSSSVSQLDIKDWQGTCEMILGRQQWFNAWLEGEKRFTDKQYNEILYSSDAWLLSEEEEEDARSSDADLRSTSSARRVKALFEQVTDRYQPLPQTAFQLRFLASVQLPMLSSYHARISSSLDAFETLSSSFIRAVPGALAGQVGHGTDTKRLTSGVDGLQRLVKALVSAQFVAVAMRTWGDDAFFLDLWAELNRNVALQSEFSGVSGLARLRQNNTAASGESVDGTLFDELQSQYETIVSRAQDMIVQHICSEVEVGLKAHWSSLANRPISEEDDDAFTAASTLAGPITTLSSELAFLRRTIPTPATTTLYRRCASRISDFILERSILYAGHRRLTFRDVRRVSDETALWLEACRNALTSTGRGGAAVGTTVRLVTVETPWRRLVDAIKLLSLEGEKFTNVVDWAFLGCSETQWTTLMEDVGVVELAEDAVRSVVRVREDCHR